MKWFRRNFSTENYDVMRRIAEVLATSKSQHGCADVFIEEFLKVVCVCLLAVIVPPYSCLVSSSRSEWSIFITGHSRWNRGKNYPYFSPPRNCCYPLNSGFIFSKSEGSFSETLFLSYIYLHAFIYLFRLIFNPKFAWICQLTYFWPTYIPNIASMYQFARIILTWFTLFAY